jgi:predicted nucleotidyltransferase
MFATSDLPKSYQDNLDRAVTILKNGGCTAVYLFGSLTTGSFTARSDIDLAVRGCPSGNFFRLLGQLMMTLDHPVDLVDLDKDRAFATYLEQEGELHKIA